MRTGDRLPPPFDRLQMWTDYFANTVQQITPDVVGALGAKPQAGDFETPEQRAELAWRDIEKRFKEVVAAMQDVRRVIYRS